MKCPKQQLKMSKKSMNKKEMFKSFLDASPTPAPIDDKKNLSDHEQYEDEEYTEVQTKCCVCGKDVIDPTVKCGHCDLTCCKEHLRKRRRLKGKMERICDNCEDKYLFESYMKLELKAEEAILMQEEIVFEKEEYLKNELKTRISQKQQLETKNRQILTLTSFKRQQILKQQADLVGKEKDLDEIELNLEKKTKQIQQLQHQIQKINAQTSQQIEKLKQCLHQTSQKLNQLIHLKQKQRDEVIQTEQITQKEQQVQNKDSTKENEGSVVEQSKQIVSKEPEKSLVQQQIQKITEQNKRLEEQKKQLQEISLKQISDKAQIQAKLQAKEEQLQIQKEKILQKAKLIEAVQDAQIKQLEEAKQNAEQNQMQLLLRMAQEQNKKQIQEKTKIQQKKQSIVRKSLKKSQQEAQQAKTQSLLQNVVVQIMAQPPPAAQQQIDMSQMFLDDPRLTYQFIYQKYAKQQPLSYIEFLELCRKVQFTLERFEVTEEKVRDLEHRKATLEAQFPERTVESSPAIVKLANELKKCSERKLEMDAEFQRHDKQVEEFEELQKTYPSALQEDFKILTKQNDKISKHLSAMEKRCEQILMGIEKKEKQAEDQFEQWQTVYRNKHPPPSADEKPQESKCTLF